MSSSMSKWPQSWKDQYNREIRKKNEISRREMRTEDITYPKLSDMPLTEESFFSTLAHFFPVNHLIIRIMRDSISQSTAKDLLLNWGQVWEYQSVFPGYYSDREKIILLLNHYRFKKDKEKLLELLHYSDEETHNHFWRLIIGLIFLDMYLQDLKSEYLLDRSIFQLGEADLIVEREDSHQTLGALLAFCYYMKKDFSKSMICLKTDNPEVFHNKFGELIRRVA